MKKILTCILLGAALCLSAVPAFAADQVKDYKITKYVVEKYSVCVDDTALNAIDRNYDSKPDSIGMMELWYEQPLMVSEILKNINGSVNIKNLDVQYVDLNTADPQEIEKFDLLPNTVLTDGEQSKSFKKIDLSVADPDEIALLDKYGTKSTDLNKPFLNVQAAYGKHLPIRAGVTNYLTYDSKTDQLKGSVMLMVDPEAAVYDEKGSYHKRGRQSWSWYVPLKITADVETGGQLVKEQAYSQLLTIPQ